MQLDNISAVVFLKNPLIFCQNITGIKICAICASFSNITMACFIYSIDIFMIYSREEYTPVYLCTTFFEKFYQYLTHYYKG